MIESRISPEDDGTGGGYGKFPGLTVSEIAGRLQMYVEEGEGRSARGILRLLREQTEARGQLGVQRVIAGLSIAATIALALFRAVVAEDQKRTINHYLAVAAGVSVLFIIGAASIQKTASRSERQLREIRRMSLEALDQLVAKPEFVSRGLEREHVAALETLKKTDPVAYARVSSALN